MFSGLSELLEEGLSMDKPRRLPKSQCDTSGEQLAPGTDENQFSKTETPSITPGSGIQSPVVAEDEESFRHSSCRLSMGKVQHAKGCANDKSSTPLSLSFILPRK